jgi:heme-degrading monooxygenase HmoA
MALTHASHEDNLNEPVIGVIKIKLDPLDAAALMSEAIEMLAVESETLPGFTAAQVLLSVNNSTVVILTEWRDHHAWAQSRYDLGVGKFMEHALFKSTTIEFELYTRTFSIVSPHE